MTLLLFKVSTLRGIVRLLEKQQTLLEHEQQLRLTKIKPETKQIAGQPKKKHWWSLK